MARLVEDGLSSSDLVWLLLLFEWFVELLLLAVDEAVGPGG